ncbi:MAG: ribosome small subunit-dependent GTPase A [SAR324 cluster bacterium]|nr:ribosome small subunit-dependent GTPase A [SAR324 cluster bacterium]MEE1577118.1 ribosome small subunit-dependent GTPase A [Deltaproteobacteria bacterium]MDP6246815.1 ribosome small subunit-dependent GTPase A [SAR324 cluster bacterium]MDP6464777.1 ribosome small subunit-dependent GTPase A [SAR324 cluster bacterium]MDP6729167.1 ribosome small subunit-dependent GTPase A [SAR324 cluster bacterium]
MDLGEGSPRLCRIRSNLFHQEPRESRIAVGDEVRVEFQPPHETGWILERLPRRTELTRRAADRSEAQVLVSNAETLIIVSAMKRPAFRYGVIDRLIAVGLQGGLTPVILFNKSDLAEAEELEIPTRLYRGIGYRVIQTSVVQNSGMEELRELLSGAKSVLCGHSGVGKSSLIQILFPEWSIKVGEVKRKSGTGRHTTILANMYPLPGEGWLVDTPGVRELMPFGMKPQELGSYFEEFTEPSETCRFKSCSHLREPDCGVKQALEDGQITEERYRSYGMIYDSLSS